MRRCDIPKIRAVGHEQAAFHQRFIRCVIDGIRNRIASSPMRSALAVGIAAGVHDQRAWTGARYRRQSRFHVRGARHGHRQNLQLQAAGRRFHVPEDERQYPGLAGLQMTPTSVSAGTTSRNS